MPVFIQLWNEGMKKVWKYVYDGHLSCSISVSLLNGIKTFTGNLMSKPSL